MKQEKQKTAGIKTDKRNTAVRSSLPFLFVCLTVVLCLLAVNIMYGFFAVTVKAAPAVPSDYGTGYEIEKLDSLNNEESFGGIRCKDKDNKSFLLSFDDGANGLVTLARISHNSSLEGYTFDISLGSAVVLKVNYEGNIPVSDGSFFGIGNDTWPFKGKIVIGGSADTAIAIAENSWRFLFNNLSNEAKIESGNGYMLYSSYVNQNDSPLVANTFVLCKTLTVTKQDGALDLSGFRFGAASGTGNSGALVKSDGATSLFAGTVKKTDNAYAFSVDLSGSLTNGTYIVESTDNDAGGIIGLVEDGVSATIGLPDTLTCKVKADGYQKNAGVLVGSNRGTVTFVNGNNKTTDEVIFSGEANATGSAGLIGANEAGSVASFSMDVVVDALNASGLRAGGLAGTCKGPLSIQTAEVKNSEFTKKTNAGYTGNLGGAIGSVDDASATLTISEGGSVLLSGNTFSAPDVCFIGGFIGALKTEGEIEYAVTVENTTITGSGSAGDKIGGFIGSLSAGGNFTLVLGDSENSVTFVNIKSGVCGGVIGEAIADLHNTVLISGGELDGVLRCTMANEANAIAGGLVGKVTGYIKIDMLSVHNSINRASSAADIAGTLSAGSVIEVGNLSLLEDKDSILVGQTGLGSVVRLNGIIQDTSTSVLNLVYQQDGSLIYLDSGCTYTASASKNNDIGNYGQVFRNDTLDVIRFDDATHVVSVAEPIDASSENINIGSVKDFAKLAVSLYTRGTVSGVTGSDYADLFGKNIILSADISLADTGIEQLTPANEMTPFTGSFDGGSHTVTLAIGQNIAGDYPGISLGVNNARASLALISCLNNATVSNLTIDGKIYLSLPDINQYVGSLAGKATGTLNLTDITVSTDMQLNNGAAKKTGLLCVGGMVGSLEDISSLSATGCTLGISLKDTATYTGNKLYFGGLSGYVNYTGTDAINFQSNNIKTVIEKSGNHDVLQMGGFIGVLNCKEYVNVDFTGTNSQDVRLSASGVSGSTGGILGYSFKNCHVIIDGAYSGEVTAGRADLGGLLYTVEGRLTVEEGFSFGNIALTATGDNLGLLLSDGKKAWVTVKADSNSYVGSATAEGFDLFVGENIQQYTSVNVAASGGIVTIETGDSLGKLPAQGTGWYDLTAARENSKTRYYFNIAAFESKSDASETVNSPEDLLYWHVFDYAHDALISKVAEEIFHSSVNDITSVTADIDMTDYCFYPTKKEGVTVNFSNFMLTFGKPAYVTTENQFFGLQAGLLSDITASGSNSNVQVGAIKLDGAVSHLGNNLGSGALICGTVSGSQTGNTRYDVKLTLSGVKLSGIRVETDSEYRPLLINRLASYVEATVSDVSQEGYVGVNDAASSLIGRGGVLEGSTPSSYIRMTLKNIVLDGKSDSSIFTKATLFYDVLYVSGSGSFIYNFNYGEDWETNPLHQVTYGAELYVNEDQRQYFDKDYFVHPLIDPAGGSVTYPYEFQKFYLPYVYVGYDSANGKTNLLLSVNRKSADFIEGYGTYRYPYIIKTEKQLESLAKWLSGTEPEFNDGWQINFPQGDWSSVATLDLTGYYTVQALSGELYHESTGLSKQVLLSYLSGAYYKLSDGVELTMSSEYAGLGSTVYPFHGVIHGNGCTVSMPGSDVDNAIGSYGYGFINVANGCAVYDLTVRYGTIVLSSDEFGTNDTPTSGPVSESLSTSLPHFGGVIAWVVGGDNLLDKVTVTADSVTPGASHTVCGGYVGLISGGGVLLDSLTSVPDGRFNSSSHLYNNNYVGRVLSGYVIAVDGATYNNVKEMTGLGNRADFVIPSIEKDTLTGHGSGFSDNTFTLASAQDLLLLSFGMNSGTFAGETGYAYGMTSLTRYGDYQYVGSITADTMVVDGKYRDDTNKNGIIAAYFGLSTPTDLRSTELTVKLTGTDYDLSSYGNAFRAISGAYANSPVYKIASFGGETKQAVISLNMDMLQYAYEKSALCETDSVKCYGLFGRLSSSVAFHDFALKGTVSLSLISASNIVLETDLFTGTGLMTSCSAGGCLGYAGGTVSISNTSLNEMNVISPDIAGGFVAFYSGSSLTVENGCSYVNTNIKGKRHTGGVAGYVSNGTVSVTDFAADDSVVETRLKQTATNNSLVGSSGGVVGYIGGGNGISLTNCLIRKTAVAYTSNYKSTSSNVAAGGIVGLSEKAVTAESCTVDGCVILCASNFTGTLYPHQLSPKTTLPSAFCDAIVYNGEDQQIAKILAWMLEWSADDSGGYSIGSVGGMIGHAKSAISLTDCTVTAESAPVAVAGLNNTGGFVGEQRNTSSANVTLTRCTVSAVNHDIYLLGAARTAGLVAYRDNRSTSTYQADDVQVVGTAEHPIRILAYKYYSSDAAGLFGDLNQVNITILNAQVSDCIIGGSKAAGIISSVTRNAQTSISITNAHIDNNLIYSNRTANRAGGLISEFGISNGTQSLSISVNGAYLGKNYIVGVSGAGGLVGQVQKQSEKGEMSAKYVILDDNVIRSITKKVSDFSFAAGSLEAENSAVTKLFDISSSKFTSVGLIAAVNNGKATVIAVSCYAPDAGTTVQKSFGTGTGSVVYAAYGAQEKYSSYIVSGDAATPQQVAIEKMSGVFSIAGEETTLFGDSITEGTPGTIDALTWWLYNDFTLEGTDIANLGVKVENISKNVSLPLLCLNGETDKTMKGYINMLTGGGFESAASQGLVSVVSNRYSVDNDGNLTPLNESGSVVYTDNAFTVGIYDNLEEETKTLTILSLTFSSQDLTEVYTMHLAIYYQRSVNMKTFVVPVENEQYYLPSFLNFTVEPSGSLRTNASYGSPFTLYVEYNYNDIAMKLEKISNFNKQIELTQSNGVSDESARIESGTAFVLIDLNSQTPAGYSYYKLVLTEGKRFIDFNSFTNGENEFGQVALTDLETIAYLSQNRVCKDTGGEDNDCVYTERYLLVVFPVQNNTDNAMMYNMKAVIDEEQRKSTNIVVNRLKEVYGQVSVWGSPRVDNTPEYMDNTAASKQFSNVTNEPIQMKVNSQISFANGYINELQSQNGAVYGTHILHMIDSNNKYVELPKRTVVTVTSESGETVYQIELADSSSQIAFSVGNLLGKVSGGNVIVDNYTITLDFSGVSENDFFNAFSGRDSNTFTLVDSLYLSGDKQLLGSGPADSALEYTAKLNTAIKLAVVPKDNRYLGINLAAPDDVTNSGEIEFAVIAGFDSLVNKTFENATLSFSVSKKVYNAQEERYEYIPMDDSETSFWQMCKDGVPVTTVDVPVADKRGTADLMLKVNLNYNSGAPDLTNYRLTVHLSATATDGTTSEADGYFVFLLCRLETESPD